jgi:hypothetical protein
MEWNVCQKVAIATLCVLCVYSDAQCNFIDIENEKSHLCQLDLDNNVVGTHIYIGHRHLENSFVIILYEHGCLFFEAYCTIH